MIRAAPARLAMAVANRPSGPEPWTTTVCHGSIMPSWRKPVITERSAQLAADAHSGFTSSGIRILLEVG